jgi:acyl-CoA reductase-like NAD-dependent aldehyde dehydrogenase
MRRLQMYLGGEWTDSSDQITVHSPFDGREVSRVARGSRSQLETAVRLADETAEEMAGLTASDRVTILDRACRLIRSRRRELAQAISEEAAKPIGFARIEAERCLDTFTEASRIARQPEVVAQDLTGYPSGAGRLALIRRVPVGPVLAITPFNFPLNLVAHKLAPAIAAGCPVVLKPASQTPSPALLLAQILDKAGLPHGALSVVPSASSDAERLASDDRIALLTFTGSMAVGWKLKQLAWRPRVTLELGGNAAVVVEPDVADLEGIARRIAGASFGYAGQSCISVQRILVHEDVYMAMRKALTRATAAIRHGDPSKRGVVCGPVIDAANADRVEEWIADGVTSGGRMLTGGDRSGNLIAPTLLEEVPSDRPVVADEVFGPVAVLDPYEDFAQALNMVNLSRYGLQAGVFTNDTSKVQEAWATIEVGGIIHNDVPTWRTDPMPYGGVKGSGVGREGPLFAYREMTEERMLVLQR